MPLTGRRILVTRPRRQAESLCRSLEAAGAEVIRLPLVEIEAQAPDASVTGRHYDWLVFTSPNAVLHGLSVLRAHSGKSRFAAVGAATAQALRDAGAAGVLSPEQDYSSEGLLALAAFRQCSGQRILLVKGQGGRTLLGQTLQQRGATVSEALVYRRRPAAPPASRIETAIRRCDSVIATSGEILQSLFDLTPAPLRPRLLAMQLVVPSERVVQMALLQGFYHVHCVPSPLDDAALVQALETARPETSSSGQTGA